MTDVSGRVIFCTLLLTACLASAVGIRGRDTLPPPGYSQSYLWLKFDTAETNAIVDSSIRGTNTFQMMGTNFVYSSGAFYLKSGTGQAWLTNNTSSGFNSLECTLCVSAKRIGSQVGGAAIISDTITDNSLLVNESSGQINPVFYYGNRSSSFGLNKAFIDNTWQTVTVVKRSAYILLYTNGVLCVSNNPAPYGGYNFNLASGVRIGNQNGGAQQYNGWIDSLYLTTYPFTAEDAVTWHNNFRGY